MIHAAIAQRCTTPERVIAYRLAQMHDDLAQFTEAPALFELIYVQLITEQAEALDAQARAHAMPSPAHTDIAIRETEEASTIGRVFCHLLRSGRSLLHTTA